MLMSEWSSDVCSSDLAHSSAPQDGASAILHAVHIVDYIAREAAARRAAPILGSPFAPPHTTLNVGRIEVCNAINRSKARRVGLESVSTCRSRQSPFTQKKHPNTREHI